MATKKAAVGFEPTIGALQALALPLGYAASGRIHLARTCNRVNEWMTLEAPGSSAHPPPETATGNHASNHHDCQPVRGRLSKGEARSPSTGPTMLDPLYIAVSAAVLLAVVVGVIFWMRRRAAERLEELEAEADRQLRTLQRNREEQLDRLEREWEGKLQRAPLALAGDLLSTYDAVDNALEMARSNDDNEMEEGLRMIRSEFLQALADHDIDMVDPDPGTPFDPDVHEAMDVVAPDEQAPHGTVAACRRAGFRHTTNVLRPALVVVARDE